MPTTKEGKNEKMKHVSILNGLQRKKGKKEKGVIIRT